MLLFSVLLTVSVLWVDAVIRAWPKRRQRTSDLTCASESQRLISHHRP